MIQSIIQFSIRNKLVIVLATIGLIAYGSYSVTKLPIDAVPDITNNQVMVITTSPSLGAADIERVLTVPIEQTTRNIPGIIEQRSFSRFGLSLVTIVFDDATDVYWARQQVSERLVQVQSQIPAGLGTPEMGPVTTGLGEIFQYVVKAKRGYESRYDALELRSIQDWVVRRQLLGTEGVADVSSFGGKLKQYEISLDVEKLRSHNLSMNDVFTALEQNNQNTGGAYIEKGPMVLSIRSEGLVSSVSDIEEIAVSHLDDASPILIRDVATVGFGSATRYGAMTYNDKGEVAGGVVMMLKGANSSQVIRNVKTKIESIQKSLPEGVEIEAFLDRTKMVNNALTTVVTNLSEGALIVIFILVLFLGNLRAGILVASVIPLSMLFAVIMMNATGVSGNLMSLGALDFGLIVDGTVIIVEAILHRLHHNKHVVGLTEVDQDTMDAEVEHSTGKIMKSAVFGQLIILIVYLPFFVLEGIEGKMFKPMAQTVSFAIIGAFILSVTYVPMMSSLVLSKKVEMRKTFADIMMSRIHAFFEPQLLFILRFPRSVIASSLVAFVVSVIVLANLGSEFIPKLEEGDFAVDTRVLTGSSLSTTIQSTQQTASILLKRFPEVQKVVTKIGSGEIPTDPMPIEASDMMVILKPKNEWTSAHSFDELAEKMSAAVSEIPGVSTGFQFPVQMRFNELMTGSRQDVVCKIFGDDLDSLASLATRVGAIASSIDGACDLYVESVAGLPQIVVRYNRAALAQYGISVQDVNRCIEAGFAGATAGQVFENERRFDLTIRLDQTKRRDIEDVRDLIVESSRGEHIPLRQVADVRLTVGPNQIQREDAQRRITVGFNVRERDVQSVVNDLQAKINSQVRFPSGYSIRYGGQFENLVAATNRLSFSVPVSLLLIFLLLYFAFNSIKQGLLIYSAIPLAAIGGIISLWISGMPFSISAAIGFIALFGVAVLNGIVLISEFNLLKKNGVTDVHHRIVQGTRILLRPILMTAAVASFGFLPMAISQGAGAEVQRPLATVVIGGLITATLLTLWVLPALYLLFETNEKSAAPRPFGFIRPRKKGHRPPPAAILILACVLGGGTMSAQEISLHAALDSAAAHNLGLRAAELEHRSVVAAKATAWSIPPTTFSSEFGQINGDQRDNKWSIVQSFELPFVYSSESQLRETEINLSSQRLRNTGLELSMQVQRSFYRMRVLLERERLLAQSDTLYASIARVQSERLTSGDNSALEATTAASQHAHIRQLQRLNRAELMEEQLAFSQHLHSSTLWLPDSGSAAMADPMLNATAQLDKHPSVRIRELQTESARADRSLQASKFFPQLSLGYTSQSFVGSTKSGSSQVYGASDRFQSFALGLNLPLFFVAPTARKEVADWKLLAAETELTSAQQSVRSEWQRQSVRLLSAREHLQYYQQTALAQAQELSKHAQRSYSLGEINLVEFLLLQQQALNTQLDYLHALEAWNTAVLELTPFLLK